MVYDCIETNGTSNDESEGNFIYFIYKGVPLSTKKSGGVIKKKKDKWYDHIKPWYATTDENDQTLQFESRFESGNLKKVIQV
jgi:hypothetical protein